MSEQPRVPAGHTDGGQWTSTSRGVGATSPSHSRGDWVKKRFDAITEGSVLTAEPGGIVEVPRDGERLYGEESRKEEQAFIDRLDPTRVWKVWQNDDAWRARDLGDKAEHDRLMGGPGIRQIVGLRSWGKIPQEVTLPAKIAGIERREYDISERDLTERLQHTMTPAVATAAAERQIDTSIKDAFKEIPKDWQPEYIPYTHDTPEKRADYVAQRRQEAVEAVKLVREQFGSPEVMKSHLEKLIVDDLSETSPGMMMSGKALNAMLSGEPLKNYTEGVRSSVSNAVKKDSRTNYLLARTFSVDAQGLGIPIDAPGSARPVHGLTVLRNRTPEEEQRAFASVRQYGGRSPILVIYKDDLKSGSTVTSGDSLNTVKRPVPYDRPTIHAIAFGHPASGGQQHLGPTPEILRRNVTNGSTFRRRGPNGKYGYDEVQFLRRPTAKDIQHVIFTKEPVAAMKKKLSTLGATWSVVPDDPTGGLI